MGNKGSSGTTTQTTEVREMLRKAAERLSAREEKTVRMRTGAGIDLKTALPRRGKTTEARAELTALEIELTRKLLQRTASAPGRAPEHAPGEAPQVRTRAKDKIIRALRRLK
ncbi:MAG: hypothetical protein E6J85_15195 [Deltaproteobacteria bacterium]|nr:MAG: hypothetical protein E6J85_15195 [Deltaproteobacteria bacterium]